MRPDTRQRKHAMAGLRAISGQDRMLGTLVRVISSGRQALDAVMLEMGRMVAESIMLRFLHLVIETAVFKRVRSFD